MKKMCKYALICIELFTICVSKHDPILYLGWRTAQIPGLGDKLKSKGTILVSKRYCNSFKQKCMTFLMFGVLPSET